MGALPPCRPRPDTAAVALDHRDFGGEGGPPLVILHGMLGSSRNWQTAGRDLAAARRVYALDLRNHGLSPHADRDDLRGDGGRRVAWLDSRGSPRRAHRPQHGREGRDAPRLPHPARVGRLVVVDIAPKDYHWPAHGPEFAAMNGLDLGPSSQGPRPSAGCEGRVPDWATRKFLATNLERTAAGGMEVAGQPAGAHRRAAGAGAQPARWPGTASGARALHRRRPVGLRQPGGPRRDPRALSRGADRGRSRARGHNPHIEAREAFVRAVDPAP